MTGHRNADPEHARASREALTQSSKLKDLHDQLEAAQRVAAKYPELAESSERKAQAIKAEIAELEA